MTPGRSIPLARAAGFTLVEIAVVLVIIGLVLGAVLQGQALIANAEYRALTSKISEHQNAFYAFRERYNALPGDYERADTRLGLPSNHNGNGNGIIDHGPECGGNADESCRAWQHLRAAGLLSGNPNTQGTDASPTHRYNGVFSSFFTGVEGNGAFATKMLLTNIPVEVAVRLEEAMDDELADQGRISCAVGLPGCSGEDYPPDGATTIDLVYQL